MIHAIDGEGNISWHCVRPDCSYHNCAGWDREIPCPYHAQGVTGQTHAVHISDPEVRWTALGHIELPACPECGERKGLVVHGDIAEPVIARDEEGNIIPPVQMPEGYEHHGNLWIKDADIVHVPLPHPTLKHLSTQEIQAMIEHIKAKAPEAPTEWMLTMMPHEVIHDVYPHPAIERHQELARQLQTIGKVPPTT